TPRRTTANMSPHHHPYRNTSNGGSSASTKPGRARVGLGGAQRIENVDDFRLDALPDGSLEAAIAAAAAAKSAATVEMQPLGGVEESSEAVDVERALNRTLHQLNASPHFNPRGSFDHQMTLSRQQQPSPQQPLQADGSESPQPSAVSANQQQRPPVAATSTTNIINLEASVVTRLATKSNYQNILSGDSEALGLTYHKEFKTGLEKRRTNHKQAEQKRRDSLKSSFEDLKMRMDGMLDPKLVSKVYLLKRANGYIDRLCRVKDALERAAAEAGVDVESVVREAEMTGEEAEVDGEDAEELDEMDEGEER
ncbi:hypothetical protein LPJ66_002565, partial [Kickxella alabastrina]